MGLQGCIAVRSVGGKLGSLFGVGGQPSAREPHRDVRYRAKPAFVRIRRTDFAYK